jgi:hypothetical protein
MFRKPHAGLAHPLVHTSPPLAKVKYDGWTSRSVRREWRCEMECPWYECVKLSVMVWQEVWNASSRVRWRLHPTMSDQAHCCGMAARGWADPRASVPRASVPPAAVPRASVPRWAEPLSSFEPSCLLQSQVTSDDRLLTFMATH